MDLLDVTRMATVKLQDAAGGMLGSGFFVAPRTIVTAAHVVPPTSGHVLVTPEGANPVIATVFWREPRMQVPGLRGLHPLPDLALLRLPPDVRLDHVCVELGAADRPSEVYAFGYSSSLADENEYAPDVARLECEGVLRQEGVQIIKLKAAEISSGMSGGPALDLERGLVIGVTKATRGLDQPVGCYAVSVTELEQRQPDVRASNKIFHRRDPTWQAARTGNLIGADPARVTRAIAETVLRNAGRRSSGLPPGVDKDALHQTIWVRRVDRNGATEDPGQLARFRWDAGRNLSKLVVVTGGPGYGKSWLVSYQAENLARQLLAEEEAALSDQRCRIPLLLDCSALAAQVQHGDLNLTEFVRAAVRATMPELMSADAVDASASLLLKAVEDGRVTFCLDGLDEVPMAHRGGFKRGLLLLLSKNNRVFLTSRPSAVDLIEDISPGDRVDLDVLGFDQREAVSFVHAWHRQRPAVESVLLGLLAEPQLARLVKVPLLLSFLCRVVDSDTAGQNIPDSPSGLYRAVCLHLLSGRWRGNAGRTSVAPARLADPLRRLAMLSRVIGGMQDRWRVNGEIVPRSDFTDALRRDPSYESVHRAAVLRLEESDGADREHSAEREDAVVWELIHDGVLLDTTSADLVPGLRFSHPVIREFVLANYFASLTEAERAESLDRHLWFDPGWRQVIVLAAQLIDSAPLVKHLFAGRTDLWVHKRGLAAELMAGVRGDAVELELTTRLIESLEASAGSEIRFERQQAVAALGVVVGANPTGRDWAIRQLQRLTAEESDPITDLDQELAVRLAGDDFEGALRISRRMLGAGEVTAGSKNGIIAGLARSGGQDQLSVVMEHINRTQDLGALRSFLGGIGARHTEGIAAALDVLRQRRLTAPAAGAVATTLTSCGEKAVAELLSIAGDYTMSWSTRAQVCEVLIRAGVSSVHDTAMRLVKSPNLPANARVGLVVALLEDGVSEALPDAAGLMLDNSVGWGPRESLARALLGLGDAGVDLLTTQMTFYGVPLELKIWHICALVEARRPEALEVAARLHSDVGVPAWIRVLLVRTLMEHDQSLVSETALADLIASAELTFPYRVDLVVQLFRLGSTSATSMLRSLLSLPELNEHLLAWQRVGLRLAASGRLAQEALRVLSVDPAVVPWARCQALISLANVPDMVLREAFNAALPGLEGFWRTRTLLALGRLGAAPALDELLGEVVTHRGGYRILYEYLTRAWADPGTLTACLESGERILRESAPHGAVRQDAPTDIGEGTIKLNFDLLRSLDVRFDSEVEASSQLRWIHDRLQAEVGLRLAQFMVPEQIDEFDEFQSRGDDAAGLAWLEAEFPEYRIVVRKTFEELCTAIRSGVVQVPRLGAEARSGVPLRVLSDHARALAQWLGLAVVGRWADWARYARENLEVITAPASREAMAAACRLATEWGLHEAHLFAMELNADEGAPVFDELAGDVEFALNEARRALDREDFDRMRLAAAFAFVRFPSAASYFYAAVAWAEKEDGMALAEQLMRNSGKDADASQVTDGVATLRELQQRLDWSEDRLHRLVTALEDGGDEGGDDDASVASPDGE
ncbi:trypsin-like peptidase domain-containing protein [Micromonospora sp. B006]|uniref:trypsin-like peptidase domain-containing protein n=1 Tax=Micromonospora sp. B006 TaxID=2201999 RepID=UPI000E30B1F7|nr:trypsin-like peptidase domain-containing protein [Micromonospora sp. B006]AXO33201.1 hypothetical protein MicB006_0897 [Micromonospora sp. B006]